ncbi:permease [Acidaminobacter sp. JC074]|uniref:permease n=1 Tax=Acidaminobacter sp. JC074 TaxID=2530199 RepID=UPI001F117A7F|nr:permease [Acidaminobacter sp. JC074]MCH4887314.1 permease [Acidaminobacter sp. JC074]
MIKKHKILIFALCSYGLVLIMSPEKILPALGQSRYYFLEMLQILPAVFILTSLIQTWVPTKVIMKYFGDGSGIRGYGISVLIGSLSAGPIYAAFPVCQTLLKKGASIKNIVIILSTWAVVKVPMLINEVKFMGFKYMIIRWILTIVAIIIMAQLTGLLVKMKDIEFSKEKDLIDEAACILCGKCLHAFPDKVQLVDGKYTLIGESTDDLRSVCPMGAIK